jgi:hypothetical protein
MATALVPADHSSTGGHILKSRGMRAGERRAVGRKTGRAGEVKLDCGKDTMWLLFDPNWRRDLLIKKGAIMKKIIVTLTCLLVAPLAFARPGSAI